MDFDPRTRTTGDFTTWSLPVVMTDYDPATRSAGLFALPKPSPLARLRALLQPQATILGVDLSHYNAEGKCDFKKIRESNVDFVIYKVGESDWYTDPTFEYSWQAALDNNLAVLCYFFFRGNKSGESQHSRLMLSIENFLNHTGGLAAVAVDVETVDGVDKDTRASRYFDLCRRIRDSGQMDGSYCSPGLVTTLFPANDTRWKDLTWHWVAHWTSASTYTLPNGWDASKVKFWQFGIYPTYSWCPKVEGAGNAVDVNWGYFQTQDDLRAWLGQDTTPPPPPPPPPPPANTFAVQVSSEIGTVVREWPAGGKFQGTERLGKGLVVYGQEYDDDDDMPALWYCVSALGDEWVRASHVVELTDADPPPDDDEPPPEEEPDTKIYTVTADKTLAKFISGYNAAGKPIFMIYPSEVAPADERIRYDTGEEVEVYPEPTRGDGGGDYYEMVYPPVTDAVLYVTAADGVLS